MIEIVGEMRDKISPDVLSEWERWLGLPPVLVVEEEEDEGSKGKDVEGPR